MKISLAKIQINQRFGRLRVDALFHGVPASHGHLRAAVTCDCGGEKLVSLSDLRSGNTQSCGCLRKENDAKMATRGVASRLIHGDCTGGVFTVEYKSWKGMIKRCTNPKVPNWKDYGGRGIQVCEKWRHDFPSFLADVGRKPSPQHSIDRYPNPDGNYEPGNVRWATSKEQNTNRRKPRREVGQ